MHTHKCVCIHTHTHTHEKMLSGPRVADLDGSLMVSWVEGQWVLQMERN